MLEDGIKTPDNNEITENNYTGIGGWLILIVIGLIVNPIRILMIVINDLLPTFSYDVWSLLTTPGTEAYDPLWVPLLIFELVGNIGFIVFSILLLILLFMKKKIFPVLMIIFLGANILFVVADYFLAGLIPLIAEQPETGALQEIFRSIVGGAIWIPYFIVSKRVKNTFLK